MTEPLKILFMGTPSFGATVLRRLAAEPKIGLTGVVTQPDRPAGRKNLLTPPEVKRAALELNLPVLQLERLRSEEDQARLREFAAGAEIFVVAAFGMLLPQAVLDIPRLQCLNVHGSLLPAYRGASPVAQALLDGLAETGVTIMKMEKGLDTGPMLSRVILSIGANDTQPVLMDKLAVAGADLLAVTLPEWAAGQLEPEPQNPLQASHTGIIKKEAGQIDWQQSATQIERKSRAYDPWPGIFTAWQGQTLKLGRCAVYEIEQLEPEGDFPSAGQTALAALTGTGQEILVIGTGAGLLAPQELQLPGKKMLPASEFLRGYRHFIGANLG